MTTCIAPALTLLRQDGQWSWARDMVIASSDDGTIDDVRPRREDDTGADEQPDLAVAPGFVNAHSHAFQRGLRGHGETFPAGAGSFWTWREAMYELVESLDDISMRTWTSRAFSEMRDAGITTVGEFHYLHHDQGTDHAFDHVVIDAAKDVGIRLVLLQVCYMHGGFDAPLAGGQRRFATPDLQHYWDQFDALREAHRSDMVRFGVVAHSIRAVKPDDIALLAEGARHRGVPLHMHVEEQPREIEECIEQYGATPMRLLCDRGVVSPMFTAVHCTHTSNADLDAFVEAGGHACICPLTEANLADGLANVTRAHGQGGSVCLGTDSNARISMLEEMRWLELGQRLRRQERGALRDDDGNCAAPALDAATRGGARSLGIHAGEIAKGKAADLVAFDLRHPSLAGLDDAHLLAGLIFGGGNACVAGTWVAGQWRATATVSDGA